MTAPHGQAPDPQPLTEQERIGQIELLARHVSAFVFLFARILTQHPDVSDETRTKLSAAISSVLVWLTTVVYVLPVRQVRGVNIYAVLETLHAVGLLPEPFDAALAFSRRYAADFLGELLAGQQQHAADAGGNGEAPADGGTGTDGGGGDAGTEGVPDDWKRYLRHTPPRPGSGRTSH